MIEAIKSIGFNFQRFRRVLRYRYGNTAFALVAAIVLTVLFASLGISIALGVLALLGLLVSFLWNNLIVWIFPGLPLMDMWRGIAAWIVLVILANLLAIGRR